MNPVPRAPACALRDVCFAWGGRPVLRGVSLELLAGEVCALVGDNGSGKSTLLQILALLLAPASGMVELEGRAAFPRKRRLWDRDLTVLRRRVTLLHQRPVLFDRDVLSNIVLGLHARGFARHETQARARAALERVGLAGFERRRARALSGGEVQRAALARAIALETPLLLLDEPFASLDAGSRPLLDGLLGTLRSGGTTILIAAHGDVAADRVVRLEGGVLREGR